MIKTHRIWVLERFNRWFPNKKAEDLVYLHTKGLEEQQYLPEIFLLGAGGKVVHKTFPEIPM